MKNIKLQNNEIIVNIQILKDLLKVKEDIESIIDTLDIINDSELMEGIECLNRHDKERRTNKLKDYIDSKLWEEIYSKV